MQKDCIQSVENKEEIEMTTIKDLREIAEHHLKATPPGAENDDQYWPIVRSETLLLILDVVEAAKYFDDNLMNWAMRGDEEAATEASNATSRALTALRAHLGEG